MIIDPSIDELLEEIDSKYMLVSLSAKRARQLQTQENEIQSEDWRTRKFVSRALKEIASGELTYEYDGNQQSTKE